MKFEEREDRIIYDVRDQDINVFSLNKENGKIEKKRIDLAWKLDGGELIKITLRDGSSIETTPEHRYLVLDAVKRDFVYKEAKDLNLKDLVVCPRKLAVDSQLPLKKTILKLLSKKRFYARLKQPFAAEFKKKILQYGIKNVKSTHNIKWRSFYHGAWQGRYLLADLLNLCKFFGVSYEKMYDNIETITFRKHGHRGKSSLPMRLPYNFEDFFYLAGLFLGDGHHKKFIVGKPPLVKRFADICKDLGINVTYRRYECYGESFEIVTSATLLEVLNSLFDYPKRKKSHNIRISDFVFKSPDNLIAQLVSGYFDTDGTIETSRRAISICSASRQMLDDLHLLLLRLGCPSQKYLHKNTIYILGQTINTFIERIGFGLESKQKRAEALASNITCSRVIKAGTSIVSNGNTQMMTKANDKVLSEDIVYVEVISKEVTEKDTVYDFTVKDNHNFIANSMVIHNSTFSDNIIAGAGMLSKELAGEARVTDDMQEEQERGITIQTAAVSMVHHYDGEDILINLLDTPGHVDFGGDVTRAMRAVDGAVVLACAVEGVMPQTETVLKQALKERVKPVLFINKVDRLIREVKLTPEAMQEKFVKIITHVNKLINDIAPAEYKEKWQVNVQDGSVAFGSAYHNWALSVPLMQKKGLSFKDIIDAYNTGKDEDWEALADRAPLHEVALNMVARHCPSPAVAQKYRIPHLWKGDIDSEIGQKMINCDAGGELVFIVTKMKVDPQAGELAFGRVFSGKLEKGKEVYLNGAKLQGRIQQTMLFKGGGTNRIVIPEVPAGNIAAVVGLRDASSGETVSEEPIETFEGIKHIFDPVVTKAIEAKNPKDLAKLITALRQIAKEDPTIKVEINEETGENLISGLGELHLEIKEHILQRDMKLDIVVSPPIVVYRETVEKPSPEVMGKSPNKHNKLFVIVEPLQPEIAKAIKNGDIPEGKIKKIKDETLEAMTANGINRDEAKRTWDVYKGNLLVDATRGIVHIGEIQELVVQSFEEAVDAAPLSREPGTSMKVKLMDAKLHEDSIHRGPGQIIPCMRQAIFNAMLTAGDVLYEPKQTIRIDSPIEFLGAISKLVNSRRGQLLETSQAGEQLTITAKLPVSEMFGFTSSLRSATSGRGVWFLVDQVFEKIPRELQDETVLRIRKRKGLKEEIPQPIDEE